MWLALGLHRRPIHRYQQSRCHFPITSAPVIKAMYTGWEFYDPRPSKAAMQAHYKWNHSPSCGKAGHLYLKNERASSDCPHHLGKMVEKVAAMMVSAHCEVNSFHPGQYRFRGGRSAADAVGVTIAQTQEAWSRKLHHRGPSYGRRFCLSQLCQRMPPTKDARHGLGRIGTWSGGPTDRRVMSVDG